MERTYKTSEVAKIIGVHPNTVRIHGSLGYMTPVDYKNSLLDKKLS